MRVVENLELAKIKGGVSGWAMVGICAVIVFLAGVFEGITSPNPCGK